MKSNSLLSSGFVFISSVSVDTCDSIAFCRPYISASLRSLFISAITADQADGVSTLNLLLQINNTGDIEKIIGRFRQIKDVIDVYRTNY